MGAVPVLLAGDPDLQGYAARHIGLVERVGPAGSELDVELVIAAANRARAVYLHPGYGFLSERPELAEACERAGIIFVGPSAASLRLCGDKLETRAAAVRVGVPVLAASPPLGIDQSSWLAAGREVGFPLLVKPAGAGGGRGLRVVRDESSLVDAILASRREVGATAGGSQFYLERALVDPRHVEVQVASDGGGVLALGDRDCSVQRRHQKVIEEAPAPNLDESTRANLHEYAVRITREVGLRGIATCEFLLGNDGEIAFLEVNPRIQVEHPVTEMVTGIDLVEWQLLIASKCELPLERTPDPDGHAIEARVYTEDPWAGHFPSPGQLVAVSWPWDPVVRIDAGYETGDRVPAVYDSMVAKVIARGSDRDEALVRLHSALADTAIAGVATNIPWLLNLLDSQEVRAGAATTTTASDVEPMMPDRMAAVIAAVASELREVGGAPPDAWSVIGPFRMSGPAAIRVYGEGWIEHVSVWRERRNWIAATSSGEMAWWRRRDDGSWDITLNGRNTRFAVVPRVDAVEVAGGGGRWTMHPGAPLVAERSQRIAARDGVIKAPLPATVLSVHASEGDRVTRGQPLVTLYAMKMELVCEAPVSGTVQLISCEDKQLVAADDILLVVHPDANANAEG
jgi:acetyl/propionyl-CoA carboxylase alpha subunit